MKILAVRGENLASLPSFELDLAADPIGAAGIFAITGPTGAGKSTILDAICLALFDRLPRLVDTERRAVISRDDQPSLDIRYDDVRNILRHGCGSGYAEVDFLDRHGRTYRATWSVTRSRQRSDGKLQPQKLRLIDLATMEAIGDTKTETLVEIRRRIGLDFDQFRRAALLAQGEFDSFVRAKSEERSALLERITGTDIYSRISREAFIRAKRDSDHVEQLSGQLTALNPLPEEHREALEAESRTLRQRTQSLTATLATLRNAEAWYARDGELEENVCRGEVTLEQSRREDAVAEPQREHLRRARSAFAARSEIDAADKAHGAFGHATEEEVRARSAHAAALSELNAAVADESQALDALAAARREYSDIGPELSNATALDARLDEAARELKRREGIRNDAVAATARINNEWTAAELQLSANHHRADSVRAWIAEHRTLSEVALRIEEIVTDLNDWHRASEELDSTERQIAELERTHGSAGDGIAQKSAEKDQAVEHEHALEHRLSEVEALLCTFDRAALEKRRDTARAALSLASEAARFAAEATTAQQDIDRTIADASERITLIARAQQTKAYAEAKLVTGNAELNEAQRSLDLSNAAADEHAELLRALLVDGEPCPVCGATEHRLHDVDSILRARLDQDRARVATLRTSLTEASATKARAESDIESAGREIDRLQREQAEAENRRGLAEAKRTASERKIPSLAEQLDVSDRDFDAVIERATVDLAELDRQERSRRDLSSEREPLLRRIKAIDDELAALRNLMESTSARLRSLEPNRMNARLRRSATADRLDRSLADAEPQWPGLPLDALVERCRKSAADWNDRTAEVRQLESELPGLERRRGEKAGERGSAGQRQNECEAQWREQQTAVAALRETRRAVIGGRPVDEVRTEYHHRENAAQERAERATLRASAARKDETTQATRLLSASQRLATCACTMDLAVEARDAKLKLLNIDQVFVREVIQRGEGWLDVEERRLAGVRKEADDARTVLLERQRSLETHRLRGRPSIDKAVVPDAIAGANSEREASEAKLHDVDAQLRRDHDCRSQVVSLRERLAPAQGRARLSSSLAALIGSSDGARFRDFAQTLTFERLVVLANRHLADLHPRFELKRTQGRDLALQVMDHDMGDEVRGVHSLSGGERFLVSLALALGLASMSSVEGVKVESLFIDEGFGALDSQSLNLAIAALERLNATGRQIGIISHLDVLQERVGVQIQVTPERAGRSRLEIVSS